MGTLYKTDGSKEITECDEGNGYSLEFLQKMVDGYIELIMMPETSEVMVVNEEGIVLSKPYNEMATHLAEKARKFRAPIYGDVLVIKDTEMT